MDVLGGAGRVESTLSGPDCGPRGGRRTRDPVPGGTSRNRSPPCASARRVAIVRPALFESDICAPGARLVTYTCPTLPWALNDAWAPAAAVTNMTASTATPTARRNLRAMAGT